MIDRAPNDGVNEEIQDADCVRRIQTHGVGVRERDEMYRILTEKYRGTVFAMCMRRLRNTHDAEEVTQEVFLRFFRKVDQLKYPDHFVGWLKRIAIRLSINHAVRKKNGALENYEIFDDMHGENNMNPILLHEREETVVAIREIVPTLKKMDHEVIVGFYLEGQSLKQLSEKLKAPVGTIKRRLSVARTRMREVLNSKAPEFAYEPTLEE